MHDSVVIIVLGRPDNMGGGGERERNKRLATSILYFYHNVSRLPLHQERLNYRFCGKGFKDVLSFWGKNGTKATTQEFSIWKVL